MLMMRWRRLLRRTVLVSGAESALYCPFPSLFKLHSADGTHELIHWHQPAQCTTGNKQCVPLGWLRP